jgi:ketosteroid isomerase-like protein
MNGIELEAYDALSVDDRAALTALCTEYMWLKDNFRGEKVPELFTDDCVWTPSQRTPHTRKEVRGRKAIIEAWSNRTREILTRTLISNLRFVKDGPAAARGWVHFTEYAAHLDEVKVPVPIVIGDWIDTYVKGVDGRWRIKSKTTEIAFGGFRSVKDNFMMVAQESPPGQTQ